MKPVILICSGDLDFCHLLSHILNVGGFASRIANGPDEAMRLSTAQEPFAAILDCHSPWSATELCAKLKRNEKTRETVVVALVGSGLAAQEAKLAEAGADETFFRPLEPAQLLDFLRTALAASPIAAGDDRRLSFADLEMNLNTYRVYRNGQEVRLCPIEFRLLRHMLARPGKVFSRDELIRAAWPSNIFVDARTVDVHIGRLRRTLKAVAETDMIRTVRSAGYALAD